MWTGTAGSVDLERGRSNRLLVAATGRLFPEIDSVDLDGEHQAMMMLVVEGRVAEQILTAERGQLADIGLDLLGVERVREERLRPDFTTH